MAGETTTTNMNLIVPGVGVTSGPQYASDLNDSLNIIDQHDHTPGSGVLITPLGLNISSDLTFLSNNATALRSTRFIAQSSPLSLSSDLGCVYVAGVDLYYNDATGNQVRITQNGGVAGAVGSISNLTSPASALYVSGNSTFVWQSNTSIAANLDAGALIMRNLTPNSTYSLTLTPPAALSTDYTLTLPNLPGSTLPLQLSATGAISTGQITTAQITNGAVTPEKIAAYAYAESAVTSDSTNSATRVTVINPITITKTTARRIMVSLQMASSVGAGNMYFDGLGSSSTLGTVYIYKNSSAADVATIILRDFTLYKMLNYGISFIDNTAIVGANTYSVAIQAAGGSTRLYMNDMQLIVMEI